MRALEQEAFRVPVSVDTLRFATECNLTVSADAETTSAPGVSVSPFWTSVVFVRKSVSHGEAHE